MRVAVLACLLVALMPPQGSKPASPTPDPYCFRPLEGFCARDKCPTYAAQIETLQAGGYSAQVKIRDFERRRPECTAEGTVGRCGPFRTTHRSNGFTAETRYFDKAGKLIAVRVDTDVYLGHNVCPDWQHYGSPITCRVTDVKLLCKPDAGRSKKE
jgi:hypothetical protein